MRINALILLVCLLLVPVAHAQAEATNASAATTLARLEAAYEGITTLSADFVQTSRFAGFNTVKTFSGHLELIRPDRMRWDYRQGSNQQIYLNGREVTVFAPASKQAIITTLTPASDRQIPLHLLADVTGIEATYHVASGDDPGELQLTPLESLPGAPQSIRLWLHPDSGLIAKVQLNLAGGSSTDITFDGFDRLGAIAAERFVFDAPKGVYVIHPASIFPGER
jgi:outer membrane lipoprotein carrier protein